MEDKQPKRVYFSARRRRRATQTGSSLVCFTGRERHERAKVPETEKDETRESLLPFPKLQRDG